MGVVVAVPAGEGDGVVVVVEALRLACIEMASIGTGVFHLV